MLFLIFVKNMIMFAITVQNNKPRWQNIADQFLEMPF